MRRCPAAHPSDGATEQARTRSNSLPGFEHHALRERHTPSAAGENLVSLYCIPNAKSMDSAKKSNECFVPLPPNKPCKGLLAAVHTGNHAVEPLKILMNLNPCKAHAAKQRRDLLRLRFPNLNSGNSAGF